MNEHKQNLIKEYNKVFDAISNYHYCVPFALDFIESDEFFIANCDIENYKINVNEKHLKTRSLSFTFIHEFSHAICHLNNLNYMKNGKLMWHHLEFAIINHCLQDKIINPKIKTYFNSYDIHEDIIYEKLGVNPFKYNEMISNIKFKTISELVEIAQKKATEIRKKFTQD